MAFIIVRLSSELCDASTVLPPKLLREEFVIALKESEPDLLMDRLIERSKRKTIYDGTAKIKVQLTAKEEAIARNFAAIAGLGYRSLFTMLMGDLIVRLLNNRTEFDNNSVSEIDEDDEKFSSADLPLSGCCSVEVFDDGIGNLMCPECGGFLMNDQQGLGGCPACGSPAINFDRHCENCLAYVGPRISDSTEFGYRDII